MSLGKYRMRLFCIVLALVDCLLIILFLGAGTAQDEYTFWHKFSGIKEAQAKLQTGSIFSSTQTADMAEQRNASEQERKRVALTFDDGPHPEYTEKLLDGLQERGVHATFFVVGENAELHPDTILRMYQEGHLIGNHTYTHIQLTSVNRETFKQELKETNSVIKEITGEDTIFVRPPYGTWDKTFEKELNMLPVLWTVDPLDWCTMDAQRVTERVISKVEEDDIILLHDYYETSVTAAFQIVDTIQNEGYEFVTVDELFLE